MESNKIFNQLKSIIEKYEPNLLLVHNEADNYYLNTPNKNTNVKTEFFAAVQVKKNYVAVHLMPIYYYPEMLDEIGVELKKRMQGKSCFNFKELDNYLFEELSKLVENCYEKYKYLNKI